MQKEDYLLNWGLNFVDNFKFEDESKIKRRIGVRNYKTKKLPLSYDNLKSPERLKRLNRVATVKISKNSNPNENTETTETTVNVQNSRHAQNSDNDTTEIYKHTLFIAETILSSKKNRNLRDSNSNSISNHSDDEKDDAEESNPISSSLSSLSSLNSSEEDDQDSIDQEKELFNEINMTMKNNLLEEFEKEPEITPNKNKIVKIKSYKNLDNFHNTNESNGKDSGIDNGKDSDMGKGKGNGIANEKGDGQDSGIGNGDGKDNSKNSSKGIGNGKDSGMGKGNGKDSGIGIGKGNNSKGKGKEIAEKIFKKKQFPHLMNFFSDFYPDGKKLPNALHDLELLREPAKYIDINTKGGMGPPQFVKNPILTDYSKVGYIYLDDYHKITNQHFQRFRPESYKKPNAVRLICVKTEQMVKEQNNSAKNISTKNISTKNIKNKNLKNVSRNNNHVNSVALDSLKEVEKNKINTNTDFPLPDNDELFDLEKINYDSKLNLFTSIYN